MSQFNNNYQSIHNILKKKKITGKIYQKFYLYPKLYKCLEGLTLDVGAGLGDFFCKLPKQLLGKNINIFNYINIYSK
jgi:hypothetical protein